MNPFTPQRLLGSDARAERAQRVAGLVDVERLAGQQTAPATRAIRRGTGRLDTVKLDLRADVDAWEPHGSAFAGGPAIPSGRAA
jgi:hypothetical protein